MPDRPNCGTCRFWQRPGPNVADYGPLGTCHRRAPLDGRPSRWPLVFDTDWCGEHESNRPA